MRNAWLWCRNDYSSGADFGTMAVVSHFWVTVTQALDGVSWVQGG
jgi:hypothetical protein